MENKTRQSNFELLRIIAMLMILNLHSFVGQGKLSLSQIDSFIVFDYFRESCSICAVNCFVLISGYFGIKWKLKSLLNLVFQVYFYVIGLFIIACLLGYSDFSIIKFASRANCLIVSYWFISAYLILYLIAPVLNSFVASSDKKRLLTFIVIYYIVQSYFCLIGPKYFNDCMNFVGLYLIGQYFRIYGNDKLNVVSHGKLIITYILISLLICVFAIGQKILMHSGKTEFELLGGVYSNPLVIIQSMCLFAVFLRLQISNKFINWCGISSLSVYLIHLSPDIKNYYISFCQNLYEYPPLYHILILAPFIIIVFSICILIDKIRLFIWNQICILINNKLNSNNR